MKCRFFAIKDRLRDAMASPATRFDQGGGESPSSGGYVVAGNLQASALRGRSNDNPPAMYRLDKAFPLN